MAEPDRLQPGKPVAAAGAAEEDREVVADERAAAAGEDRWAADQARSLLLATVGREPSDAAAVCVDGAADCWATTSVGIAEAETAPQKTIPISPRNGELSQKGGSGSRAESSWGRGKGGWEPVILSGGVLCSVGPK